MKGGPSDTRSTQLNYIFLSVLFLRFFQLWWYGYFYLVFFYFATLTIQTGCFQHNIRSLMTYLQVCQKIFPLLSKDFFLFWVSCCAARTKKILIVFWKPAFVAENINVSLRKQRETETFKENIHILIILMLDFQSFNSWPDLTPLTKSIWKTLSGGNFI